MTISYCICFLFRHENTVSLQSSCATVAGAAELPFQTQINNVQQQLEKHPTNSAILWEELPKATTVKYPTDKTILWEELPKVAAKVTRNASEQEMEMTKEMISMIPPSAMITGAPSMMLDTDDEMKTNERLMNSESTWDKPAKDNGILPTEGALHLKGHADLEEQMVERKSSCPSAQCVPYYVKPEDEYRQLIFLDTCPSVTNIAGMASKFPIKEHKHWVIDQKSVWEKQSKMKEIFPPYISKDDEKNKKEMILLAPSCPKEARNPGFPSVLQNRLVFYGPNMVDIYPGCPRVSNITGSPSISEADNRSWISQKEPLLEKITETEFVVMTVSPKEKDEIKLMGGLVPTCPKHSCIPSISQSTIAHHGSDMMSLQRTCTKASCIEGIPSLMEHLSKNWDTDYKPVGVKSPKIVTVMIEGRPHNDDMKAMTALAPTCAKETCIPGFPSALEPTVIYNGFSVVNLLPSCPAFSSMAGFPLTQKADSKDWNTVHQPLWEKQIKKESVLILENNKMDKDMKGVVSLAQSCPKESLISGFLSVPKPRMINVADMANMVSLANSCSKVSQIPGFPSSHNSKEWTVSIEPLFEAKMIEKQVSVIDSCGSDKRAMKAMVSLVPSCPKEARTSGFPSHPNPPTVYCVPNIISLFALCSQVSKIPGFPSVDVNMSVGWVTENGSLLKRMPKEGVIFDTSIDNKKIMKNMVSCVPSCPKVSSIPGFPSIPNPKIVYYGLNVVSLLPLCPLVSTIPGFSSVERHQEGGWFGELGSLIPKPPKYISCRICSSPITIDKPNNMLALVSSCPGASKIPGYPSVPRYNILSLVLLCPKVSSLLGFASFEGASKCQWLFDPHTSCYKSLKKTVFVIHSSNQDGETVKTMLALVPSCPEASRIPGFPSAPQTKSKSEPNMICFVPCCGSTSRLYGFASITTIPSTDGLNEIKPVLMTTPEKRAEIIMSLAGQDQLYYYNMKSMVKLVTSCPKEARLRGFPSAQVVNRPPNMVSLYTSAPCVSCIPGFPSARMLSYECINIQTSTTHSKSLFEKLQSEKMFLFAQLPAKHGQDEMRYMVEMAPSCPHFTQIPGFPSISQLNPTEKETMTVPLPCSTEKHTSQELPNAQSTLSYLKDARIPDVPFTSFRSPSTAFGETFTALRSRSQSSFFALFLYVYFTMFAFMTEEKFKGATKENIDLILDNG